MKAINKVKKANLRKVLVGPYGEIITKISYAKIDLEKALEDFKKASEDGKEYFILSTNFIDGEFAGKYTVISASDCFIDDTTLINSLLNEGIVYTTLKGEIGYLGHNVYNYAWYKKHADQELQIYLNKNNYKK